MNTLQSSCDGRNASNESLLCHPPIFECWVRLPEHYIRHAHCKMCRFFISSAPLKWRVRLLQKVIPCPPRHTHGRQLLNQRITKSKWWEEAPQTTTTTSFSTVWETCWGSCATKVFSRFFNYAETSNDIKLDNNSALFRFYQQQAAWLDHSKKNMLYRRVLMAVVLCNPSVKGVCESSLFLFGLFTQPLHVAVQQACMQAWSSKNTL